MVNITITYDRDEGTFKMRMIGHAGGDRGENVICAGVSFAAWQTVAVLEAERYSGKCALERCRVEKGDADISAVFAGTEAYNEGMKRLEAVRFGLGLLERKYPGNVCINIQGYNSQ